MMKGKDIAKLLGTHDSEISKIKKGDRGISLSISLKISALIGGAFSDYHGKKAEDAIKIFEQLDIKEVA